MFKTLFAAGHIFTTSFVSEHITIFGSIRSLQPGTAINFTGVFRFASLNCSNMSLEVQIPVAAADAAGRSLA